MKGLHNITFMLECTLVCVCNRKSSENPFFHENSLSQINNMSTNRTIATHRFNSSQFSKKCRFNTRTYKRGNEFSKHKVTFIVFRAA